MALKVLALFIAALVALTLGWVLLLMRAEEREAAAEQRFPPQGQFLRVGDINVHAVVMGRGPDLVLIHGASGSTRDMTFSLAPRLAENYRVFVIDRPGLGYTDRLNTTGASLHQQATLLRQAAEQLGASKPIVVGHSYGGAVALAWAVYYPDDIAALVPISAPSNPWTIPLDPLYRVTSSDWGSRIIVPLITALISEERIARTIRSIFAPQSPPDGYAEEVGAALTLRRVSMRANADQRANLLGEIKAQVDDYGLISVPTEIVHGTADETVGLSIHSEKLVDQIPGAVLTRLEGIGHMPHHASEDEIVAAIDRAASRAGLR
ncbi:alpha/beta fold hydrolase [Sedimentitalea sp. XS_ASV28]|uniref:alpha/beta fold hydrolase n=1 Tax=Sedimentitalea sp. XS_ASV28 TaxID=3241296 RepID=UPI003510D7F7